VGEVVAQQEGEEGREEVDVAPEGGSALGGEEAAAGGVSRARVNRGPRARDATQDGGLRAELGSVLAGKLVHADPVEVNL